jgi:hypothetical protein
VGNKNNKTKVQKKRQFIVILNASMETEEAVTANCQKLFVKNCEVIQYPVFRDSMAEANKIDLHNRRSLVKQVFIYERGIPQDITTIAKKLIDFLV